MTVLIRQRTGSQCAIASIAMATGRDYDEVLTTALESDWFHEDRGCQSIQKVLEALGYSPRWDKGQPIGDFVSWHREYTIAAEFFRSFAWGRRAILSVPSLNIPGGTHAVYWDGRTVYDPNPDTKKRYTEWTELLPTSLVLFREAGHPEE